MADDTNLADQRDDAEALVSVMDDLERRSQRFGSALTSALQSATVGGKGLDSVLQGLATKLSNIALSAGLKPLENMLSSAVGNLTSGAGSLFAFAKGGVPGRVTPLPMAASFPARRSFRWVAAPA